MTTIHELLQTEPESIPERGYGADGRTVKLRWHITEPTTNEDGSIEYRAVTLHCSHSPGRKVFNASMILSAIKEDDGCVAESYWVFGSNVQVHREPVARYGTKARDTFVQRALTEARAAEVATRVEVIMAKEDVFNA